MDQQELNQKFQIFEKQIMQLQEQLRSVEQAIYDMQIITNGLDELVGKEGEEIMAPMGRGLYVKSKLLSDKLTVDVGGHNFVEKTIPETKELISEQKEKLKETKAELEKELEKINEEVTETMKAFQKAQSERMGN